MYRTLCTKRLRWLVCQCATMMFKHYKQTHWRHFSFWEGVLTNIRFDQPTSLKENSYLSIQTPGNINNKKPARGQKGAEKILTWPKWRHCINYNISVNDVHKKIRYYYFKLEMCSLYCIDYWMSIYWQHAYMLPTNWIPSIIKYLPTTTKYNLNFTRHGWCD